MNQMQYNWDVLMYVLAGVFGLLGVGIVILSKKLKSMRTEIVFGSAVLIMLAIIIVITR